MTTQVQQFIQGKSNGSLRLHTVCLSRNSMVIYCGESLLFLSRLLLYLPRQNHKQGQRLKT